MWACNREERLNNTGVYKHLTKVKMRNIIAFAFLPTPQNLTK